MKPKEGRPDIQQKLALLRTTVSKTNKSKADLLKRVAHFLLLLGIDHAAAILKHLNPEEVEKITAEMLVTTHVSDEEAAELFQEFKQLRVGSVRPAVRGGIEKAREMLEQSFGKEKTKNILHKLFPEKIKEHFSFLMSYTTDQIYFHLKEESVQVASLLLFCLPPVRSAKLLRMFPQEEQLAIVKRITNMQSINEEVVASIAESLYKRLRENTPQTTVNVDGIGRLADILKHSSENIEGAILSNLAIEMPQMEKSIRERMFSIDIVLDIPLRQLQEILFNIDDKILATLIKTLDDALSERLLSAISERRKNNIRYELNLVDLGLEEAEKTVKYFTDHLHTLYREGKIALNNEMYN